MAKSHVGEIRRSQAISTFGPGALIDLPKDAAIIGGLEGWHAKEGLEEVREPRLAAKLQALTGVVAPKLRLPPREHGLPWQTTSHVTAWRFPQWFLVQEAGKDRDGSAAGASDSDSSSHTNGSVDARSRRLIHQIGLDPRAATGPLKYRKAEVVPIRFVRACFQGHVSDVDWIAYAHRGPTSCKKRQLWLDEKGTGGDLVDLAVRCACGARRTLGDAMELGELGPCDGSRPWLGRWAKEPCGIPTRLLIRTASNAYFPQLVTVLSLPDQQEKIVEVVQGLWDFLEAVEDASDVAHERKKAKVAVALEGYPDAKVLDTVRQLRKGSVDERPVKQAELDAILAAPEGYGDDVPVDPDFHARRLADNVWRKSTISDPVESVIQLHRLREVSALTGFTRFEAITPDINGEYDSEVKTAPIAIEPSWFPAVENRGEGIFVQLSAKAIGAWLKRAAVTERLDALVEGHSRWMDERNTTGKAKDKPYVGGPYALLHTLSHLILQSLSMTCGYPASSIRERIYVGEGRYGFLLYTGSPDAEGTLGGLVQEARHFERHLVDALRMAALCSNDPICAAHDCGKSLEKRWLHGAACHACAFIAETSCEMRNDHLDRALVVPVLGCRDAAFFPAP